jgi:hypothetical protein
MLSCLVYIKQHDTRTNAHSINRYYAENAKQPELIHTKCNDFRNVGKQTHKQNIKRQHKPQNFNLRIFRERKKIHKHEYTSKTKGSNRSNKRGLRSSGSLRSEWL